VGTRVVCSTHGRMIYCFEQSTLLARVEAQRADGSHAMVDRLTELIRYRELIKNLVIRDLKVRYKSSLLGFLWSLLNPLAMMTVFTIVFTFMMPDNSIPKFPVFVLCALLPWNFFRQSVMDSITSIVNHSSLIKKVYFPREVLPLSMALSNLVNFLLALTVLLPMLLVFRVGLTRWALLLPLVIFTQVLFTLGLGFMLSAANVFYRDTAMIMDVVMLAWFFVTPIFYPIDILPTHRLVFGIDLNIHRLTYVLNPMASLISTYRVILFHGAPPAADFFFRTFATSAFTLIVGYLVFARYSKLFAEEV